VLRANSTTSERGGSQAGGLVDSLLFFFLAVFDRVEVSRLANTNHQSFPHYWFPPSVVSLKVASATKDDTYFLNNQPVLAAILVTR
jgi:hypothetical protein